MASLLAWVRGRRRIVAELLEEKEEDRRLGVDVASPLLAERDADDADALERGAMNNEPLLGPVSPKGETADGWPEEDGDGGGGDGSEGVNSFRQESWEQLRLAVPTSITRFFVFVSRTAAIVFVGQLLPVEKLASAALANSIMVGARASSTRPRRSWRLTD